MSTKGGQIVHVGGSVSTLEKGLLSYESVRGVIVLRHVAEKTEIERLYPLINILSMPPAGYQE